MRSRSIGRQLRRYEPHLIDPLCVCVLTPSRLFEQFNIVTDKMTSWVTKKIHEYLGEEEPTMIEFIIKKLQQRAPPQSILDELKLVLDDEAEMFVQLLWRRLAFEALRSASS